LLQLYLRVIVSVELRVDVRGKQDFPQVDEYRLVVEVLFGDAVTQN
jgi:hypothetical protein